MTGQVRVSEPNTRPLLIWAAITGAELGVLVNDGARCEHESVRA